MTYEKHRAVFLLSVGGGLAYAFCLTLGMKAVEILWYHTPCLS